MVGLVCGAAYWPSRDGWGNGVEATVWCYSEMVEVMVLKQLCGATGDGWDDVWALMLPAAFDSLKINLLNIWHFKVLLTSYASASAKSRCQLGNNNTTRGVL